MLPLEGSNLDYLIQRLIASCTSTRHCGSVESALPFPTMRLIGDPRQKVSRLPGRERLARMTPSQLARCGNAAPWCNWQHA